MSNWQPIESAPTDERILAWNDGLPCTVYALGDGRVENADGGGADWREAYWMPLPAPPQP